MSMYNFYIGDTAGAPKSREDGVFGLGLFLSVSFIPHHIALFATTGVFVDVNALTTGRNRWTGSLLLLLFSKRCLRMELFVLRRTRLRYI